MAAPEIRRIRPDEWRELRRLRLAALRDAPRAFGSTHQREAAFADDEWRRRATAGAAEEDEVLIVASTGSRFVGTAKGSRSTVHAADAFLVGVYVMPAWRGHGLARAASVAVVAWARERGFRRLILHVADWNDAASRLYASLGFVPTGATEPLPHDPSVTEIEMALDLH